MSNTYDDKTTMVDAQGRDGQVLPMPLGELSDGPEAARAPVRYGSGRSLPLEAMLDVPITLVFEVGRTEITIRQLMELNKGSVIDLRQVSVDTIDMRVNDVIIARGECIALKQRYGIRLSKVQEITRKEEGEANNEH